MRCLNGACRRVGSSGIGLWTRVLLFCLVYSSSISLYDGCLTLLFKSISATYWALLGARCIDCSLA